MDNKTLNQEWNKRKVEADNLLSEANQQLEQALNSYKQALDIYIEIGNNFVADIISSVFPQLQIRTNEDTEEDTENSEISRFQLSGFVSMPSRRPIIKPPKRK